MQRLRPFCLPAVLLGVIVGGCGEPAAVTSSSSQGDMAWWDASKSDALRHDLQVFENNFENQVEDTASTILQDTTQRGIRLAALTWKTRLLDRLDEKVREPNPIIAMLDAWALAVRQSRYLTTGDGKRIFGPQQEQAVKTARQIETEIETLAKQYIPDAQQARLEKEVQDYADKNPLTGVFEESKPASLSTDKGALDAFGSILALPLAPLASAEQFGKGVQDFNVTAAKFTDTISELPADTRWQLEVLLINLDTTPAIKSLLESLDRVSKSSEAYADIARQLPKDFENVLDTSVDRTANETRPLIDHAAWRIAQLLALAFILAVVLVFIIRRTRPGRSAPAA